MTYLLLKWIHVISASLLFGTRLGSAYFKWRADRSTDLQVIYTTNRNVVLADWIFTAPAVLLQPASGLWLMHLSAVPLSQIWVMLSMLLFVLAGLCWLPVVALQIKMRDMAGHALQAGLPLPHAYDVLARYWFWLGVPAFAAVIAVFGLMVFKPV